MSTLVDFLLYPSEARNYVDRPVVYSDDMRVDNLPGWIQDAILLLPFEEQRRLYMDAEKWCDWDIAIIWGPFTVAFFRDRLMSGLYPSFHLNP